MSQALLLFICKTKNVICACMIILRQLDHGPYRYLMDAFFITPVDFPFAMKHIRYFLLCLIRINAQIL